MGTLYLLQTAEGISVRQSMITHIANTTLQILWIRKGQNVPHGLGIIGYGDGQIRHGDIHVAGID